MQPALTSMVDLHVHGGPSLMPRHALDQGAIEAQQEAGVALSVLKAHEGSTVERAALCGPGAVGGIVLNSAVGGANAEAVEIAGRLGGRVVWMPTVSSSAHQASLQAPELQISRPLNVFSLVEVVEHGKLRDEWHDVFDVIAQYDMVLASGHVACREALLAFQAAAGHGVQRLLLTHPMMDFLSWEDELLPDFRALGAFMELGILPDLLQPEGGRQSVEFLTTYPAELLVFGSDLGHAHHPRLAEVLPDWLERVAGIVGSDPAQAIMTTNGLGLVSQAARIPSADGVR